METLERIGGPLQWLRRLVVLGPAVVTGGVSGSTGGDRRVQAELKQHQQQAGGARGALQQVLGPAAGT